MTASLLYSEDESALRGALRELIEDRSPWPEVLRRIETDEPYDPDLWRRMTAMGLAGLAVAESDGGAGASARETAVVLEELGRGAVPSPFLGSAVLATTALQFLGIPLAELASGAATAALVVPLSTAPGADVSGAVRESGGALSGVVTSVADAAAATVLVVPAGDALYRVPAADAVIEPVTSLDLTRRIATVRLDAAPAERLDGDGVAAVRAALVAGAGLLASEQLGIAERCLELTIEHLRTRYQFARPLGSFQALKHRVADLWVQIAQARAVARYAAGTLADGDPDAPVAASIAQAHCSPLAVRAAEECVQLHGGIGFTWEHPAHLYLKRARADALALGTADRHRAHLGDLVGLTPA